jgi:hypothetical protein
VRVRVIWNIGGIGEGGVRFYLSYSGSAPSGANCVTLAGDIDVAWANHCSALTSSYFSVNEIDVLDIASNSGQSGQWTGTQTGTRTGNTLPVQVCTNVEYGIGRRYRGGKPRGFYPFGTDSDHTSEAVWSGTFLTAVNTGIAAFFSTIEGLSVGSMGTLQHVNLSYYSGFTNHTNPSGRSRAVPTYRAAALLDTITGYSAKGVMGSQRRRRTSTTP